MSYTIEVSEPIYTMLNQQAADCNSSLENFLEYSLTLTSPILPAPNKDTEKRNLQNEIVKLYSTDLGYQDLLDVKMILANFFAQRAMDEADKIWDQQGLSAETMEMWLNEG